MRVICIETTFFKEDPNVISVKKGNIYHITRITDENDPKFNPWIEKGIHPSKGEWYEFLETSGSLHYHERFLEIPDDSDLINEFQDKETKELSEKF
jgi:hypothetical protein